MNIFYLWLSSLSGIISSRKQNKLLDAYDSPKDIFLEDLRTLSSLVNLTDREKELIKNTQNYDYLENITEELKQKNMTYISKESDKFPAALRLIPDSPVGIFAAGALPSDDTIKIAVIGSRYCTEYGKITANMFSKSLSESGIVIVSGMARGVDSIAHKATIEAGGKTIAVLGCGLDICYPSENRKLRDEIINSGCLISEYPPGTRPLRHHFPARNRIISGMSNGIIVTEAAAKSGTMITVGQAIEQGKDVFAVPGCITMAKSEGTNKLIKDGAFLVDRPADVLFALGLNPETEIKSKPTLTNTEKLILNLLADITNYETIVNKTEIPGNELPLTLLSMEMKELIKKLPGNRYMKLI